MAHPTNSTPQAIPLLYEEKEPSTISSRVLDETKSYDVIVKGIVRAGLLTIPLRPAPVYKFWKRFAYAFVPQLLRELVWKDHAPQRKQFSTSYLNGLRGCTALKVFTFHYMHAFSDSAFQPWGVDERHRYILELPIVRYFYAGFTSHIFFGVAGYLMSLRLLQLMDDPDPISQAKVLSMISASLFRRGFRLYLPVFIITLMTATYIYFGYYEYNRPFLFDHGKYFPGNWNEEKPRQYPTYHEQLRFWGHEMWELTNVVWERTFYPWHDQHLWSIASEMRASLHLSLCLLMLAQCTRRVRLVFFALLTGLYFCWNHWEIWVYILGAMIAQIDVILNDSQQKNKTPLPSSSEAKLEPMQLESSPRPSFRKRLLHIPQRLSLKGILSLLRPSGFITAFYLLSYPIGLTGDGPRPPSPGYNTLNLMIPDWMVRKDKFYPNIGTALLLLLLVRSNPKTSHWRAFLNSRIPQYMGSISFGFYLVHGPVMHVFGYMVPQGVWWWLGKDGPNETSDTQWIVGILVGWLPTLVVSLWAADVWTREVEGRCVRVVKVLEGVCFRGKGGE
jgi:peptidoglycan/LPS O-acetylase OafA/YrhL